MVTICPIMMAKKFLKTSMKVQMMMKCSQKASVSIPKTTHPVKSQLIAWMVFALF